MLKSFLNDIFYIIHNYSFIQSFSIHHFSYSEQAGGYPSMHWRGGREGSQSVTQTDQHTHVHTRIHGQFRVFSSCCLHLFGQWKESGASSRNQGDAGRRCNHHKDIFLHFILGKYTNSFSCQEFKIDTVPMSGCKYEATVSLA